jgi:AcrR family transcriptional regulator
MAQRTKTRRPLSRERILRAALDLADEGGVEAITMRKLGGLLGFEAMSLYNHVGGKDDVLDGILDLVLAETVPPSPDVAWDAAIRESALSVHAALTRHPWSCPLLMRRVRPARMQYMDSLLGRLRTAGFSADATYSAYHVLDGHIFGFSLWETSHTYTPEQASQMASLFERVITPDAYTYLHEHGQQHFADGPHREVSAFELGLDLIVAGLKQLHDGI